MASSQTILRAINDAVRLVSPVTYYLMDECCPKTDELGGPIFFQVNPNIVCKHRVILMHPDNFPIFERTCKANGITALDQRDCWKEEEQAFHELMANNAWAYGQALLDKHGKDAA